MENIKIGTRGSKLALAQTELVKAALLAANPALNVSIEIIKTQGDVQLDVPLAGRLDKGFFTTEIEAALVDGSIDLAVHSLKDLPVVLPSGLQLAAVLPREDVRDVIITTSGKKLEELDANDVVATSSLRRKAQLLALNPKLQLVDIRGNVDTRLRKLHEGYCSALVIAAAGIHRLGIKPEHCEYLPYQQMIPAASQAAVGIEIAAGRTDVFDLLQQINHSATWQSVTAERIFLQTIEGGCHVPSGCFCEPVEGGFRLTAFISRTDGSDMIRESVLSSALLLNESAVQLAHSLLNKGGRELMALYCSHK